MTDSRFVKYVPVDPQDVPGRCPVCGDALARIPGRPDYCVRAICPPTAPAPKSYKVGVKTTGDGNWGYNALRFATREQAERYGADLAWRWTAVREYEVHPSDDAPGDERGMR